jgi:hypothetical protein
MAPGNPAHRPVIGEEDTSMNDNDRQKVFMLAIAAAIVFAIIGILYLTSHFIPSGFHWKHAVLAFVLAAGSLLVANFNRPAARIAARR